ncbi:MAG: CIA30 family protein [Lentisphaeraceae bacterium]|nr:CIA30 family protein [Lentisphaeraceae bacterium]
MLKCLTIFLLLPYLCFASNGKKTLSDSFDKTFDGWRHYGSGQVQHIQSIGNEASGALNISCANSQQSTLYKKIDLANGLYEVEIALRSFGVKKGLYDYSTWIFYESAAGKQTNVVTNLKGTYEWSKIKFTVEIKDHPLTIWLRLKSAGVIWMDDFKITRTASAQKTVFTKSTKAFPKALKPGEGQRCDNCYRWMPLTKTHCVICSAALKKGSLVKTAIKRGSRLLTGFENTAKDNEKHYNRKFNKQFVTEGQSSAAVKSGAYNKLRFDQPGSNDWSGYEYVALDVYNPSKKLVDFALCVNDLQKANYWNQLNHYSKLAPGWNYLKFNLKRYVGERGSVKNKRYVDLKNIKTFWFMMGGEKPIEKDFYVDNLRLESGPEKARRFTGLKLFDFVKDSFRTQEGFTGIETRHTYSEDVGFGFKDARIWKAHDSMYADTLNRDGIFINGGKFLVDLPNGKYRIELNVNHLGYWNEHFWNKRQIDINGQEVMDEAVQSYEKYLQKFLRFQDVEPAYDDNPYDLYLKGIFKPIVHDVVVNDGQLEISVNGDNSAICFNSLIIYPKDKIKQGNRYKASLYKLLKNEFMTLNRYIKVPRVTPAESLSKKDVRKGYYFREIESSKALEYREIPQAKGIDLSLRVANGGRAIRSFYLRPLKADKQFKISCSDLVSAKGDRIVAQKDWVRYGVNQYQSLTYNHEVYVLAPRFLRSFSKKAKRFSHDLNHLIWLQIAVNKQKPGIYKGELIVQTRQGKECLPISLEVLPFSLPGADLPIGYFGLSYDQYDFQLMTAQAALEYWITDRFAIGA